MKVDGGTFQRGQKSTFDCFSAKLMNGFCRSCADAQKTALAKGNMKPKSHIIIESVHTTDVRGRMSGVKLEIKVQSMWSPKSTRNTHLHACDKC